MEYQRSYPTHQPFEPINKNISGHNPKTQSQLKKEIQSLKQKLMQKDDIIHSMHQQINSLKSPLNSYIEPSNFDHSSFFDDPNTLNAIKHETKNNIQQGNSNQMASNDMQNMTQQSLESQYIEMRQRYKLIENETRQLKIELNQLFKSKESENEIFNTAINSLQATLNQCQIKLTESQNQNEKLINDIKIERNLLEQQRSVSISLQNTIIELKKQLVTHQEFLTQKQAQIKSIENDSDSARIQFLEKIKSIQKHSEINLECQKSKFAEILRNQRYLHEKTIQQINSKSEIAYNQKVAELNKQNNQYIELNQAHHKVLNELIELKTQVQKKSTQISIIQTKNQCISKQLNQLNEIIDQKNDILEQYQSEIRKYDLELTSVKQELVLQINKNQQVEKQISEMYTSKYKANILKFVTFTNQIISSFRKSFEDLKIQTKNTLLATQQQLKTHIIQFNQQLMPERHQRLKTGLSNESSLFNREEMLQFEVEQLKKELVQLKLENFDLKYEKKKYEDKKKQRQNFKEIIQSLKLEIEKLNSKIKIQQQQLHKHQSLAAQQLFKNRTAEKQNLYQQPLTVVGQYSSKTHRQKALSKAERRRKQSSQNDEKIIQEINEMRKIIKHARQQCHSRQTSK